MAEVALSDSLKTVNEKTTQMVIAFLEREQSEKRGNEFLEAFAADLRKQKAKINEQLEVFSQIVEMEFK